MGWPFAKSGDGDDCIDALRLSVDDAHSLLETLEKHAEDFKGRDRRTDPRIRYSNGKRLVVTLFHPGGSVIRYAVEPRNISSTGVGFLHGSFVHIDTKCVIALHTVNGKRINCVGTVVRCQHVRGTVHEVGVHFRDPIDLNMFIAAKKAADDNADLHDQLPRLIGRILYITDSIDDAELLRFMGQKLGVTFLVASNIHDAVQMICGKVPFDLALLDQTIGKTDGIELIQVFRRKNIDLPMILLACDAAEIEEQWARKRGCNGVLVKPLHIRELAAAFLQYLPLNDRASEVEAEPTTRQALWSTLWTDTSMRPLIRSFLGRLDQHLGQLRSLLQQEDHDAVARLLMKLKSASGSYGYPAMRDKLAELHTAVSNHRPLAEIKSQLQSFAELCNDARKIPEDGSN